MRAGIVQTPWEHARLLITGQTTVYVTGDNGTNQTGKPKSYVILTTGQYSGTTDITINSKTDAHSNACVYDQQTGLLWSRAFSVSVGAASDGKLPFTTNGSGEGIYPYAVAANTASLAGFSSGWRIPNEFEAASLFSQKTTDAYPDSTAFPSPPTDIWCSTTRGQSSANGFIIRYSIGDIVTFLKVSTSFCMLVKGGF